MHWFSSKTVVVKPMSNSEILDRLENPEETVKKLASEAEIDYLKGHPEIKSNLPFQTVAYSNYLLEYTLKRAYETTDKFFEQSEPEEVKHRLLMRKKNQ